MIYGAGTDLVSLKRIMRLNKKFSMSFTKRILSPEGLLEFPQVGKPISYLAKRFAAKETSAKAAGTDTRGIITSRNVGVGHDALGKPEFFYAAPLMQQLKEQGITWVYLSMSDKKNTVSAFVVAGQEAV